MGEGLAGNNGKKAAIMWKRRERQSCEEEEGIGESTYGVTAFL